MKRSITEAGKAAMRENMRKAHFVRHPPLTDAEYLERLKSRCVVDAAGCWLFQGFRRRNGYGDFCVRNKNMRAHRAAFMLAKGPIPVGHDVCHTCDVRNCCNPDHLWTGPRQLNNRDTTDKRRNKNLLKTHCPRGHSYSEHAVLKLTVGYKGWRECRICNRARMRIKAGWPEALAYSAPLVPPGATTMRRTFNKKLSR